MALDHERDRLIALVDAFLESIQTRPSDERHDRIDTAMLVVAIAGEDEDGDACEMTTYYADSKRRHVQRGLLLGALAETLT